MNDIALCIKCGVKKTHPYDKCGACGFSPKSNKDRLRSLYLSSYRFSDTEKIDYWTKDLVLIGQKIRDGEAYCYEVDELRRMADVEQKLKDIPAMAIWGAVLRLFLPGVLFIAGIYIMLLLLRSLG